MGSYAKALLCGRSDTDMPAPFLKAWNMTTVWIIVKALSSGKAKIAIGAHGLYSGKDLLITCAHREESKDVQGLLAPWNKKITNNKRKISRWIQSLRIYFILPYQWPRYSGFPALCALMPSWEMSRFLHRDPWKSTFLCQMVVHSWLRADACCINKPAEPDTQAGREAS